MRTTATRYRRILVPIDGGPAADGIEREARRWKADVIVMGTSGRRGISRAVLGSDAEMVARAATVPVVLVRAPVLPFA